MWRRANTCTARCWDRAATRQVWLFLDSPTKNRGGLMLVCVAKPTRQPAG